MEIKIFNYMLEIDILRNSPQNNLSDLRGGFSGFWCLKTPRHSCLKPCPAYPDSIAKFSQQPRRRRRRTRGDWSGETVSSPLVTCGILSPWLAEAKYHQQQQQQWNKYVCMRE